MKVQRSIAAVLLAAAPLVLLGCYSDTHVVNDGWDSIRQLANKSNSIAGAEGGEATKKEIADPALRGFTILVATYDGPHRHHHAKAQVQKLTREYGVDDLWMKDAGERVLVLRGHYGDPDTDIAQEDLRQTRHLLVDSQRPYADAALVSLAEAVTQAKASAPVAGKGDHASGPDPLDLHNYKGDFTILIGFYEGHDRQEAAEKAARELRDHGVDSFYLHGDHVSYISVGLFTIADFPDGTPSPRVKAVQAKYPYYLANGRTQVELRHGERVGQEPSLILEVN